MTFKVETHKWRTADGKLVDTGHPAAAVLAYPAGSEIPEDIAEHEGLKASSKPQDKSVAKPQDKSVDKPDDKAPDDDLEALRAEAEKAGVTVDKRWGADRLKAEIDAAGKSKGKA